MTLSTQTSHCPREPVINTITLWLGLWKRRGKLEAWDQGLLIHGIIPFPYSDRDKQEFVFMWIILNSYFGGGAGDIKMMVTPNRSARLHLCSLHR